MPVVRVSEQTKRALLQYAARLQLRWGRRVDFDEAIAQLLREVERRPDLLLKACGLKEGEALVRELYEERRRDEAWARRKYSI